MRQRCASKSNHAFRREPHTMARAKPITGLGSQDSGAAYEEALLDTKKYEGKKGFALPADLVTDLLEPGVAPTAEERYGLERMLLKQQQQREEQYSAFRQHWYELQARDFRREILSILDAY